MTTETQFSRTEALLGVAGVEKLKHAHVAVFGVGGVGGHLAEALVRAGVGEITVVDRDEVSISNINRQIVALHSTVGCPKVEVIKDRLLDINPEVQVHARQEFFLPDTADRFDFSDYQYIADAVDTVTAKLELVMRASYAKIPIISAMGAGNKLRADMFRVADIYDTTECPLCRIMRKELKKREVDALKVVYSPEPPSLGIIDSDGKLSPASLPFVPPVMGLIMAGEIIKDLVK